MCGIIGIVGTQPVATRLIDSLKRLEYRGYDSAGIAAIDADGQMNRRRAPGKIRNLEEKLAQAPLRASMGMAQSAFPFSARWRLSRDCCAASHWIWWPDK